MRTAETSTKRKGRGGLRHQRKCYSNQRGNCTNGQHGAPNCPITGESSYNGNIFCIEQTNLEWYQAGRQLDTFVMYSDRLLLYRFQVRASSVPPPRELPTAPLIQRQRRGSIAPGAPASNVSSRLREREAEFARQVNNLQTKFSGLLESFIAASHCITLL